MYEVMAGETQQCDEPSTVVEIDEFLQNFGGKLNFQKVLKGYVLCRTSSDWLCKRLQRKCK